MRGEKTRKVCLYSNSSCRIFYYHRGRLFSYTFLFSSLNKASTIHTRITHTRMYIRVHIRMGVQKSPPSKCTRKQKEMYIHSERERECFFLTGQGEIREKVCVLGIYINRKGSKQLLYTIPAADLVHTSYRLVRIRIIQPLLFDISFFFSGRLGSNRSNNLLFLVRRIYAATGNRMQQRQQRSPHWKHYSTLCCIYYYIQYYTVRAKVFRKSPLIPGVGRASEAFPRGENGKAKEKKDSEESTQHYRFVAFQMQKPNES